MLRECLDNVRNKTPLIHNITNYVTVNDVANAILACGGSPIMSDEVLEAEEITAACGGLNINIGTLREASIKTMFIAGKKACALRNPVLLDPVGAGASTLRTDTARRLISELQLTAIKGNVSEIKTLFTGIGSTKGVDADTLDAITEDTLDEAVASVKKYAKETKSIIAVTGAIDLAADENRCYVIRNGRSEMERVTGTGCQISGIMTAFLAANRGNELTAAAASICMMGLAGEIGYENLRPEEGNASYRNRMIDAMYRMTGDELERRAKIEVR